MPRSLTTAADSLALALLGALADVAVAAGQLDSPVDESGRRERAGPWVTKHQG